MMIAKSLRWGLILSISAIGCLSLSARASTCDPSNRALYDKLGPAVVAAKGGDRLFGTYELTDSEDTIILLQLGNNPNYSRHVNLVTLCAVVPRSFDVQGGQVVKSQVVLDPDPPSVVGIGPDNTVYFLGGFPDADAQFNDMTRALKIKVDDAESARVVYHLYLDLTGGLDYRFRSVGDWISLQLVGVEYMENHVTDDRKAQKDLDRWWAKVKRFVGTELKDPIVTAQGAGWRVHYTMFDSLSLTDCNLVVNSDGTVSSGPCNVFFDANKELPY